MFPACSFPQWLQDIKTEEWMWSSPLTNIRVLPVGVRARARVALLPVGLPRAL